MKVPVRHIEQQYWRHEDLPYLELRCTRDSRQGYKAHSHDALSIGIVETGRTRLRCRGRDWELQAGDLVMIEPGLVHACDPIGGQPRSYRMLYVDTRWCLDRLAALYGRACGQLYCEELVIRRPERYGGVLSMFEQLGREPAADAAAGIERFLRGMLAAYCSPQPEPRDCAVPGRQIRSRLLESLDSPPSLAELAGEFGCTRETIIRTFRRAFGITPKAFVNNARIERAKPLLRRGDGIADVSLSVGYADQSQFHRAFVDHTASTPRQYQQACSIFDNKC